METLEASDILVLKKALKAREQKVESNFVKEKKTSEVERCPHCGSIKFGGHGTMNGHKRFRCKAETCRKTFNAFTNTAFARLRKAEKHIANAKYMLDGLSVRAVAKKIGVNKNTAFLWRHRFLSQIQTINPSELSGIVEADETFFLENYKGQKAKGKKGGLKANLGRDAKVRATPSIYRGLSYQQIPVMVARDRSSNQTLSAIMANRTANEISRILKPVLDK